MVLRSANSQSQSPPRKKGSPVEVLVRMPSSQITAVASAFISRLEVNDIRYDITCYGAFLADIPKRLGMNDALDASVSALNICFASLHTRDTSSVEALTKYVQGLKALRVSLSNPVTAKTPETLVAIYFMMICQGWMGRHDDQVASHGEGIAYILKNDSSHTWRENFEVEVLITLCVPVIAESIANPRIELKSWFWKLLDAYAPPKPPGCEDPVTSKCAVTSLKLRNIAKIPDFVRKPAENLSEIWPAYYQFLADSKKVRLLVDEIEAECGIPNFPYPGPEMRMHRNYQTAYGILLSLSLVLNGILQAFNPGNTALMQEAIDVSNDALILANEALKYRPLGAGHVPLCLTTAWAAVQEPLKRVEIEAAIAEYQRDSIQWQWMDMARWWKGKFTGMCRSLLIEDAGEIPETSVIPRSYSPAMDDGQLDTVDTRRYCDMCRVQ
ncbi:Fc.00g103700.m01.CDS01 [Cosmosporella sp. VM-42]